MSAIPKGCEQCYACNGSGKMTTVSPYVRKRTTGTRVREGVRCGRCKGRGYIRKGSR